MRVTDNDLYFYSCLIDRGALEASLGNMPTEVEVPLEALGDLPSYLSPMAPHSAEFSQYVDYDVRSRRYMASPPFEGGISSVVAPDLRRPRWAFADLLRQRRRARALSWHTHGIVSPGQGSESSGFSLIDIVTIALLPPRLRSPIQLTATAVSVEGLLVTTDATRLVPLGWSLQGRPPVKLYRHMLSLLQGEVLAATSQGGNSHDSPPLSGGRHRGILARAAGKYFGLAYYLGSPPIEDGPLILRRVEV